MHGFENPSTLASAQQTCAVTTQTIMNLAYYILPETVQKVVGCDKLSMRFDVLHNRLLSLTPSRLINTIWVLNVWKIAQARLDSVFVKVCVCACVCVSICMYMCNAGKE